MLLSVVRQTAMLVSSTALSMGGRAGGMPAWAARAAALARVANDPDALSEGAIPPLPLELRSLCKGAWHRYASGGAVPPLPSEMRESELERC